MMTNDDAALADACANFYDDPLGFVMFAYDWERDPALQVVKLQEPWRTQFGMEYGPDKWACEFLEEVGAQVLANRFDGRTGVAAQRHAICSGHGIGKSAVTAWLVNWIMSTRPHSKGIVTANSADQLASKTWAEIAKWTKRCLTKHWFNVSTGKGAMRMVHVESPESWRCDAQTCKKENSESFAGLHAASATPFYIYDEASTIPPAIWDVSEGGLTDGEPMWFVFGNPTRNSGNFFECFGKKRHRWKTRQVDSRTVQITNKDLIQEWVDDYGEDSDFMRVRVRGVFPRASSLQFIARDIADKAATREVPDQVGMRPVIGVDVARFGDDQSVIVTRLGRDARSFSAQKYRGLDNMQLAARVAQHINALKMGGVAPICFVDGGGNGGGVIDRLNQLHFDVIEVQFGGGADDPIEYLNKRAEMWGRMREWLDVGCIENDEELITDLTSIESDYTDKDQIRLEKKEAMKKRGLASPDWGDALALTFAQPFASHFVVAGKGHANTGAIRDYDPYAA